MQISPEALAAMRDSLEGYDDGFIRVNQMTVGGGCCSKLILGVTLDEEFNDEDDLRFEEEGLPIVIEKRLYDTLKDLRINLDPEEGIVVTHS